MAIWPIICHYSVHSLSEACSCLAIVVIVVVVKKAPKSGGQSLLTLLLWLEARYINIMQDVILLDQEFYFPRRHKGSFVLSP